MYDFLLVRHCNYSQSSATSIFQPPPSFRTTTSSQHARPSGVLRRWSNGLECAAWRPPRPVAQCRQFPEEGKDASVSECTWTLSALEALRNALYKFKTYLLTYLLYLATCELFDVEWYRDLEIWLRGHSRSVKLVPFKSLGAVFYSPSILTGRICCRLWDILRQRVVWPWKQGNGSFKVIGNGTNDRSYTSSYSPSIVTMALSCIVCEI